MKLNDIMEFDHVIRVNEDGTVSEDIQGIYAPSLYDDELDSDKWEFFSTGYTLQDSYSGPIMHNSEFIGGQLERDILETPGVYVVLVSYYSEGSTEDGTYAEGWAVVRMVDA